jgi:hypothetical protein
MDLPAVVSLSTAVIIFMKNTYLAELLVTCTFIFGIIDDMIGL